MKTALKIILSVWLIATISDIKINAQNVGSTAPDFTLNKLEGGTFTLSEQSGKVVFIFFFGNACPHCLANGPNTQTDIYELYKNNSNFVAIGVDTWNGNASAVQSYKTTTGIEYPLLLNGSALEASYSTTYDRIIVIDQQGIIKYKSSTVADKTTTAEANNIIASLLASPSGISDQKEHSKQFLLSPNIVQNELKISNPFNMVQSVSIKIIDMTGKVVYLSDYFEFSQDIYINTSILKSGVYMLVVDSKSDLRIAKFIKTN